MKGNYCVFLVPQHQSIVLPRKHRKKNTLARQTIKQCTDFKSWTKEGILRTREFHMKHWFILSAGFLSTYCLQLLAAGAGVMGWTSQCSCSQALTAPGPSSPFRQDRACDRRVRLWSLAYKCSSVLAARLGVGQQRTST